MKKTMRVLLALIIVFSMFGNTVLASGLLEVKTLENGVMTDGVKNNMEKEDGTLFAPEDEEVKFKVRKDATGGKINGENFEVINVETGKQLDRGNDPVRQGYKFKFWSLEKEGSKEFDFSTEIKGDMTLYAVWEDEVKPVDKVKVQFDSTGGKFANNDSIKEVEIEKGTAVTKIQDIPTKSGYNFKHWAEKPVITEFDFSKKINSDLTLYAVWEEVKVVDKVKVQFDPTGGKFANNSTLKEVEIEKGTAVTKITETPMKLGYTFKHWAEKPVITEFDFSKKINSDLTLYAVWEEEVVPAGKVRVVFDLKGGELPSDIRSVGFFSEKISDGKIIFIIDKNTSMRDNFSTLTEKQIKSFEDSIEKRNYSFRGWKVLKVEKTLNFTTKINENTNVYADWYSKNEPVGKIKVTFDPNRGEFKNSNKELLKYVEKGEQIRERDIEDPKRKDYKFKGWTENKKTEKLFSFSTKINEDKILYAVWESNRDTTDKKTDDKGKNTDSSKVIEKLEKLNKINHFEYIKGYEDGSIRPEANISREEVATVFYRLLDDKYRNSIVTEKNNFSDKANITWSNKYISSLANGKIISGYEDGSFKPNDKITRAEVAVIASRFDSLSPSNSNLSDVQGHWAERYIGSAVSKGWLKGYPDGTFKPNEYITRAEFVSLVNNVLDRKVKRENTIAGIKQFKDLSQDKWYYDDMIEATNGHTHDKINNVEKWKQLKTFNYDI